MAETIDEKNVRTVEGICGICPGNCAVEIDLLDGKIDKIRPSQKHTPSSICLRGSKAKYIVYSKDRLTKPLIRTGPKGTAQFREASWDEALEYAADGFKKIINKYGPQALASHFGRGGFDQVFGDFTGRLTAPDGSGGGIFSHLGSPNNASVSSLCFVAFGVFAPMTTMGVRQQNIRGDFDKADTIVVWGANPPTASPPTLYTKFKKLRERGTKIVVVDHYDSIMAKNCDQAFIVKSGTDLVLVLGLMNYMIENNLYDKDFVENYTFGFEDLRDYVKDFDMDRVLKATGLSEKEFKDLAKIISSDKVALNAYTGLEYTNSGVQTIRSVYCLWALSGNIDREGTIILSKPKTGPKNSKYTYGLNPIGAREYPLFSNLIGQPQFTCFPKAVLKEDPYKVAGLFNVGACLSVSYPSSELFEESLKKLEMFVTVDRFMTKDALYADVILPSTTYFEDQSYVVYPNQVRIRDRIIEPIGESKNDIFIVHDLAEKMGIGDCFPKNFEELIERRFASTPEVLAKIKAGEKVIPLPMPKFAGYEKFKTGGLRENDDRPGFNTPTGKFEFKSTLLESFGYDGLPVYTPAQEGEVNSPEIFKAYPIKLNTGARIQTTFRTQHLNIPELVQIQEAPLVHMNSQDAKERGIEEGDQVIVSTVRGEIKVKATISDKIKRGDSELNVGGGQDFQLGLWKDANANKLTDLTNKDPISGFPVFKDLLCQIRKA
ncbi:MAG: molybdopterin-dependent oxidoreductase [Finegoldia sp.]|nr:molybdopterin-dependent oxidoreductase [Finegoldia sp.]